MLCSFTYLGSFKHHMLRKFCNITLGSPLFIEMQEEKKYSRKSIKRKCENLSNPREGRHSTKFGTYLQVCDDSFHHFFLVFYSFALLEKNSVLIEKGRFRRIYKL